MNKQHYLLQIASLLLLISGAYQFTPHKDACLKTCRAPIGFLMNDVLSIGDMFRDPTFTKSPNGFDLFASLVTGGGVSEWMVFLQANGNAPQVSVSE